MHWFTNGLRGAKAFMGMINSLAALLSGMLVFIYMFLVTTNITGRYFFNHPIDGTMEIGQIVLATVIFFNLAYAQMKGVHIRVTAVLERLPGKWRERFETAILAIGFAMMVLMAWRSFPFAMAAFHLKEAHMSVDVPIWPTKLIFFIGWSMLGIQFLVELLNRLLVETDADPSER